MNTNRDVTDESGRSQVQKSYVDQFSERQTQMLARKLLELTEIGTPSTGLLMQRDCDPPPDPERRTGLLRRLLGS